jgi:hypothetical protein
MTSDRIGIVMDLETIPHPKLEFLLGTEEKLARLNEVRVEALPEIARVNDIKIGNLKDPEKIKAKIAETYCRERDDAALKPYGCQICTIAAKALHGVEEDLRWLREGRELPDRDGYVPPSVWNTDADTNEEEIVDDFLNFLAGHPHAVLMGFNIAATDTKKQFAKGFDIQFLRVRAAMLGLAWPKWMPCTISEDRYSHHVFDLRSVLTEGSLDVWLRMADLPQKTDSGANVRDMEPKERALYCANDVELERLLCGMVVPTQGSRFSDLLST